MMDWRPESLKTPRQRNSKKLFKESMERIFNEDLPNTIDLIVQTTILKAQEGNLEAIKFLWEMNDGKPENTMPVIPLILNIERDRPVTLNHDSKALRYAPITRDDD